MCCTWLTGNAGPKKSPKVLRLCTIAQLCSSISSQLRHVSTVGKKLVTQQYFPHMSLQYGELRQFQPVSCLCSVTARNSSSGHQSNFAALNRGRHLYLAGQPSRWALAHILVSFYSVPQCSHCKRCTSYGISVCPSVCHTPVLCQNDGT